MQKKILLTFFYILIYSILYSQDTIYPTTYFISPVGKNMLVSGNFAELRLNHYHSGIDLRTKGAIGEEIYAAADGYVSRINISPWGYGNALYITHPNGYKTVYGHLNNFSETIKEYAESKQYALEQFAVNLYLGKEDLVVKQGDVIGYSGNTGRSYGPHLHFEIRETENDEPYNPFLFFTKVLDNIKPEIFTLAIYPFNDTSFVDKTNAKKIISVAGSNGKYTISNNDIEVYGKIIFGVEAYDYLNSVGNRNAVYSIDLYVDDTLIYSHKMDKFLFSESRFINSMVDYKERITSEKRIQRSYIAPNNLLNSYTFSKDKGIFTFTDDKKHQIKYIIKDIKGNSSELKFSVKSVSEISSTIKYKNIKTDYTMLMPYNVDNYYITNDLRISVYKKCLYENLYFYYSKTKSDSKYSDIHNIHNQYTPLHSSMTISINAEKVPEKYIDKAIIARKNDDDEISNCGGKNINGFITAKSNKFGSFYILVDTVAPVIKAVNISKGVKKTSGDLISFKVTDNLSGLETYDGYIDNKWILFKFDGKNDLVYYECDKNITKGEHNLIFIVKDERGNQNTFSTTFYYN